MGESDSTMNNTVTKNCSIKDCPANKYDSSWKYDLGCNTEKLCFMHYWGYWKK